MKSQFKAKIAYRLADNQVAIQTISEPFYRRCDAEKFIADQKLIIEMMKSTLLNESIEKCYEIILDYNTAKIYVDTLKFKSKQEYYNWWDKCKPSFLPRDLESYYGLPANGGEI